MGRESLPASRKQRRLRMRTDDNAATTTTILDPSMSLLQSSGTSFNFFFLAGQIPTSIN
jgi:hypothetical protein